MNLRQLVHYRINFTSKNATISGALMGAAIFLQVLYFTLVKPLSNCNAAELALNLWFPLVLEVAWIVLLRCVKLRSSGIFGMIGAIFCLLLITQSFFSGSVLLTILSVVLYLLAGAALLTVMGGFIPYRSLAVITMALPGIVALLGFVGNASADYLLRLSVACSTLALAFFPGALQKVK